MPSTHLSLHYHVVFGIKDHKPVMNATWRPRLHAYLGGLVKTLGGMPEAIGGAEDHVHLLIGLRATHCLADAMRELKTVSSRWVHEQIQIPAFAWQEGYGAFTVSPSQCETVRRYIEGQEEHHRTRTLRDEYLALLHATAPSLMSAMCSDSAAPAGAWAVWCEDPVAGATG